VLRRDDFGVRIGVRPEQELTHVTRRTKSIGTKVTADQYAELAALAGGQPLSEWLRELLLALVTPHPRDEIVLAELLALRTILLNLHFAVAAGEAPTTDGMQRLIERADQHKLANAQARLAAACPRRPS
jgi:hypothetical protein